MSSSNMNLTSETFWLAAPVTALIDVALILLLLWRIKPHTFRDLKWTIVGTSSALWTIFGVVLIWGFWDFYYRYFYAGLTPWLILIIAIVFAFYGFVIWWLAYRLPGNPIVTFCLLGGVEGLIEHVWGVYGLGILQKVPMLQNVSAPSIYVFSFFEYILYWGIVLGVAALIAGVWRGLGKLRQGPMRAA